jgi:hypothetical protein
MNEYTIEIWFKAKGLEDALVNLERIQQEMIKQATGDHFEENSSGLGWDVEINGAYQVEIKQN